MKNRYSSVSDKKSGQTLIMVLFFVLISTILVVTLLFSTSSAVKTQGNISAEHSAENLALSAVQLVEGTITYATEPTCSSSNPSIGSVTGIDTTEAWACQPGMIRTYQNNGTPLNYYKLYSSPTMVVAGNVDPNTTFDGDLPSNWNSSPSLYVDLNAPTVSASGLSFPIVDPRAVDLGVEGFSYSSQTPVSGKTISGVVAATNTNIGAYNSNAYNTDSASAATVRLPMPVAWIYILRDGTMTAPDGGAGTNTAQWISAANPPSANNPIVGRFAFWTDDECSKININTASEGTFWSTPVANSGPAGPPAFANETTGSYLTSAAAVGDLTLVTYQGVQNEFQRYPGHPSTTCLSSVFGNALQGQNLTRGQIVKAITDVVPRISDSTILSSMGGTNPIPLTGAAPLTTDLDRLYASLDEFQFSSSRSAQSLVSGSGITGQDIQTCSFFLTAASKAPEINLFGLPRIAIWPLLDTSNTVKTLTSFDQQVLNCSTIAKSSDPHQMAFFRYDATSTTNDYNLLRNQQVLGYLNQLMSRQVPGFGGSFNAKYSPNNTDGVSSGINQILMEIFDYIRCINLDDESDGTTRHCYTKTDKTAANNIALGQVVPTQPTPVTPTATATFNNPKGFGRVPCISELALCLVKVDDRSNAGATESATNQATTMNITGCPTATSITPKNQTLVEWSLIPKLFSPEAGYIAEGNDVRIHFSNINLTIGGQTTTPCPATGYSDSNDTGPWTDIYQAGTAPGAWGVTSGGRDSVIGGMIGMTSFIYPVATNPNTMYPTGLVVIPKTNIGDTTGITISGSVTVQIFAPNTSSSPLQTYNFVFPMNTCPVPGINLYNNNSWQGTMRSSTITNGSTISFSYNTNASTHYTYNNGRLSSQNNDNFFARAGGNTDVMRSLVPTGPWQQGGAKIEGDMRLIAGAQNIPNTVFQLTPANLAGTVPGASTFYASSMRAGYIGIRGNSQGRLVSSIGGGAPEVPAGINGVTMAPQNPTIPGDWDNGPGLMFDGPYINKPDEGAGLNGTTIPYIGSYYLISNWNPGSATFFSPNRQVSSPVMFGSLPVSLDQPWRTLLFRPATLPGYLGTYTTPSTLTAGTYTHPGGGNLVAGTIPDHLLLDLFWMPTAEPYAISEPMATSGKINLNTQIAPFTYINRTTGLYAVLKPVMITALANAMAGGYKNCPQPYNTGSPLVTRYPIDLAATVSQLTTTATGATVYPQFNLPSHSAANPNFFVSASQICDVPLVPLVNPAQSLTTPAQITSTLSTFWAANGLTGDNSLEQPYSAIYPRVTTKSNIFTVHVYAQSLQKVSGSTPTTWTEGTDLIRSENQAAYTIEKYFDPNKADLSDDQGNPLTAANDGTIPVSAALRGGQWRLLGVKRVGQ